MTQQMTGAEMVIQAMIDQGVEHIFGYPGGAVLPIYDAMFQQQKLRHILVRHEQGAVHAAEGYARSTGKVGCVLVTSGPGGRALDLARAVVVRRRCPTHPCGVRPRRSPTAWPQPVRRPRRADRHRAEAVASVK